MAKKKVLQKKVLEKKFSNYRIQKGLCVVDLAWRSIPLSYQIADHLQ